MRGPYQSRQRVLTGVAAGLGARTGINPNLLRAAWVCSIPFTIGLSVAVYGVLAAFLPVAPEGHVEHRPAFLPQSFAAFVLGHGLIHVIGFLPAWRLPSPAGFDYTTLAFYGQVDLGDAGAKALGLAWLAVAIAYVVTFALLWRGSHHATLVTALVSAASATICALSLPLAPAGLVIDVALIAVLVARNWMAGRPAPAALRAAATR